jgi:hypothetical protein
MALDTNSIFRRLNRKRRRKESSPYLRALREFSQTGDDATKPGKRLGKGQDKDRDKDKPKRQRARLSLFPTLLQPPPPVPPGPGVVDRQIFNADGTWTKPGDLTANALAFVQVWGGGSSGGSSGISSYAGGGGGGGYHSTWVPASALGATESVTVGTGGASVTANETGNSGNPSYFGSGDVRIGARGGVGQFRAGGHGGHGLTADVANIADGPWKRGDGNAVNASGEDAFYGGGGGSDGGNTGARGGRSFAGGGGGGGHASGGQTDGGTSFLGGAGGYGFDASPGAEDGYAPGGGGGGSHGVYPSGAGADGRIIITIFD